VNWDRCNCLNEERVRINSSEDRTGERNGEGGVLIEIQTDEHPTNSYSLSRNRGYVRSEEVICLIIDAHEADGRETRSRTGRRRKHTEVIVIEL
jgi:hypothetical protein